MSDDIFYLDTHQLEKLRLIERGLHGDGSSLSPDERRDMANLMTLILNEIDDRQKLSI